MRAQRDLKSAALPRPKWLARWIDQNLGIPQNDLLEWIVKLEFTFRARTVRFPPLVTVPAT